LFFSFLAFSEISLFFAFLPALMGSSLLAGAIGVLFLTLFSYLILLFYYQAKKPDQLNLILEKFTASCKACLGTAPANVVQHLSLADTLLKLSQYLEDYEYRLIQFPNLFPALPRLVSLICSNAHNGRV